MTRNKFFSLPVKTIIFSGAFVTLAFLQSCAEPKVAPQFTADPAAFSYAISEAAEMQMYVSECSKLGSDIAQKAAAASSAWNQRNWPQVQAADLAYSQQLSAQVLTYNNEKIALPAIMLHASIEKDVKLRLDQTRHSENSVLDTCTRKMSSYADGSMDLSREKNFDLYLKSLATSSSDTPYKVPSLAGTLATDSKPGSSQYSLEKTLRDSQCINSEILTLRNESHYEVYGAFCADGKSVFVSCEWGECKIQ